MFNISELQEKPDTELRSIAEKMGMQKAASASTDNLVNFILDQQAIDFAANAAGNGAGERKRRQPRQRKEAKAAETEQPAQPAEQPAEPQSEKPASRRRGRKTSERTQSEQTPDEAPAAVEEAVQNESTVAEGETPAESGTSKRRGRPKGSRNKGQENAASHENGDGVAPVAETPAALLQQPEALIDPAREVRSPQPQAPAEIVAANGTY